MHRYDGPSNDGHVAAERTEFLYTCSTTFAAAMDTGDCTAALVRRLSTLPQGPCGHAPAQTCVLNSTAVHGPRSSIQCSNRLQRELLAAVCYSMELWHRIHDDTTTEDAAAAGEIHMVLHNRSHRPMLLQRGVLACEGFNISTDSHTRV